MIPKLKDRISKDIVDVKKWKTTTLYNFKPTAINKILNWADAIYKNNFFKLYDRISKSKKMKDGSRTGVRGTGAAKRGFRKAKLS